MATSSGLFFGDNLQPIATRGKKARDTLLVDQHCGNGCSIKREPLSVSYYNEISGGHIGQGGCSEEMFCRPSTAPVVQRHLRHMVEISECHFQLEPGTQLTLLAGTNHRSGEKKR